MPTMQDIADRVGVHQSTVSNVLNGKFKAERPDAAQRADRIRRMAEELGYRPSVAARATRTGRTGFLGMIRSPRLSCSVHEPSFDTGLDEALHARGLCLLRDVIDDADDAPRIVRENAVDGLIINYAFGTPKPVRDLLDRCRIPAVWINRKRDANCVRPNDEGAGYEATRFLIDHGHRRIEFIAERSEREGWQTEPHYSKADRHEGYARAMREAGLTPLLVPFDAPADLSTFASKGYTLRAYCKLLDRAELPTAVVCESGRTMLHAAALRGLSVPGDLSVISFDNTAGADNAMLVDRVLVPFEPMGRVAVDELCRLIEQPDRPRPPVVIPFEFHRTGTVGRPGRPQPSKP